MADIVTGWITMLDRARGRGLITSEDGRNYAFRRSSDVDDDFDLLVEQDSVTFTVEASAQGPRVIDVRLVSVSARKPSKKETLK